MKWWVRCAVLKGYGYREKFGHELMILRWKDRAHNRRMTYSGLK